DPCPICSDPRRDAALLCVVEESGDVNAIERAGRYRGRYHVLGGRISPLDGIGPDELHLDRLVARLTNGSEVREVIVATNPSMEGEATATYLQQIFQPTGVRVTRIARGMPVGGVFVYADAVTIAEAVAARREMSASIVHQSDIESIYLADIAKHVIHVVLVDQHAMMEVEKLKVKNRSAATNHDSKEMCNRVVTGQTLQKRLIEVTEDEIDKLFG